jgi:hypothetical protein
MVSAANRCPVTSYNWLCLNPVYPIDSRQTIISSALVKASEAPHLHGRFHDSQFVARCLCAFVYPWREKRDAASPEQHCLRIVTLLNFRPKRTLLRNIGGFILWLICVASTQQNATSPPCTETLKSLDDLASYLGDESYGTRTRKWLRWRGPVETANGRPVLSSERAPQTNKPATVRQ